MRRLAASLPGAGPFARALAFWAIPVAPALALNLDPTGEGCTALSLACLRLCAGAGALAAALPKINLGSLLKRRGRHFTCYFSSKPWQAQQHRWRAHRITLPAIGNGAVD